MVRDYTHANHPNNCGITQDAQNHQDECSTTRLPDPSCRPGTHTLDCLVQAQPVAFQTFLMGLPRYLNLLILHQGQLKVGQGWQRCCKEEKQRGKQGLHTISQPQEYLWHFLVCLCQTPLGHPERRLRVGVPLQLADALQSLLQTLLIAVDIQAKLQERVGAHLQQPDSYVPLAQ
ncbi:hypothetical protein EYF80_004202 [Liparis tanakae]|uniref:Uncharacterized protein n=1 Tax=Liparis tanakae TaxID=230148 RepID=A0A4Z2J5T8_9TELE|nr:hypothetical protein EYF80_004202 [Liparis tanakae]